MKPYRCEHLPDLKISHVIDRDRQRVVCSVRGAGHDSGARRIAAALNRDEARKATKPNSRWSGGEFDDSTPYLAYDGETIYDMYDVAALLNKLGATLPQRTRARKGRR